MLAITTPRHAKCRLPICRYPLSMSTENRGTKWPTKRDSKMTRQQKIIAGMADFMFRPRLAAVRPTHDKLAKN